MQQAIMNLFKSAIIAKGGNLVSLCTKGELWI